jgi:hypothetical protein
MASTLKIDTNTAEDEPVAKTSVCEYIKLIVSSCIVYTLITVVFTGIILKYCVLQLHPAINFILLFCALTLLGNCFLLIHTVDLFNTVYRVL